ncbi:tail fiber protein [Leifsonia sp. F6_8S_P_1B]|uniref:Tail fiber protein n=1 Tax=Leifsonia williamsii TaxID=3035919 RepID=A0ABT8K6L6_9MICO|nr:tail fiber protein [Leifsonia williamsii]MDN4613103.1 tail fiber protein [Leifsonia williamsii]
MSEPFIGELRLTALNYVPPGWAICNGQTLPISQNEPLFALLGTRFGGDGQTTFNLPDLRGRVPLGPDNVQYSLGQTGGEAAHTLTQQEMPAHGHALGVATTASAASPAGAVLAQPGKAAYAATAATTMSPITAAGPAGQSQAHENLAPSLGLTFMIALQGVFPNPE